MLIGWMADAEITILFSEAYAFEYLAYYTSLPHPAGKSDYFLPIHFLGRFNRI